MSAQTVTVSAEPLRQVLMALIGPGHLIRELQFTRDGIVGKENPINVLIEEFNASIAPAPTTPKEPT